jgi:hypothetical protein
MQRQFLMSRASWLGMVAMALGSGAMAQAQRVEEEEIEIQTERPTGAVVKVRAVLDEAEAKGERYWIGVSCSPAGEALRTQLGLAEDQGLVVDEVIGDSPAAKANLKKFDVLLAAGDKPLKSLEDLVTAVQNAKESAISLLVLRGGNKETVTVTPTKSRQEKSGVLTLEVPAERALGEWLQDVPQSFSVSPDGRFTIRRVHPGIAFKYKSSTTPALPKNVSITIQKSGEEPANITVKRDDKTWNVTENKVDGLPEDIRKIVHSFLGHIQAARIWTAPQVAATPSLELKESKRQDVAKALTEWKKAQIGSSKVRPERSVEERLESLDKKLEKLQRAIEELRK